MRTAAAITVLVLVTSFASTAADTGEITMVLDAAEYVQGDVVTVTLHNGTDVSIQLVSQPWFCVDRLDDEYPPCVGLPVIFDLDPGETLVGTHDTALLPDEPGQYLVSAATGAVEPVPYRLVTKVESHENSWSTLKSIFR